MGRIKLKPRGKPFEKGHAKIPGTGRAPGTPNKITQSVREAVKIAFDNLGGAQGLTEWATKPENQTAFYNLASKLIPLQVTGDEFGPLQIEHRNALSDKVLEAASAPSPDAATWPATPARPNGKANGHGVEGA